MWPWRDIFADIATGKDQHLMRHARTGIKKMMLILRDKDRNLGMEGEKKKDVIKNFMFRITFRLAARSCSEFVCFLDYSHQQLTEISFRIF